MNVQIRQAKTDLDYIFVRNIRIKVFVIEQQIPWQWEFDRYDESAIHLLVEFNNQIIGTGRLYQSENDFEHKLGRMSVLKEFRGKGLGTKILKQFEIIAKEKNISEIYLEAQSDKLDFYLKENYVIKGNEYIMDGISHKLMFKIIS